MNYYEILEVNRDANYYEIAHSYRRLAFQYHPDKNSDKLAKEKFQAIQEAYDTLKDPAKRQQYDQKLIHEEQSSFPTTTNIPHSPTDPTLTREQQVAFYAKQQNWSQVFQLIREGVSPNGLYEDLSALHYAVQYNNPDCVISLLKVRAHIDLPNVSGDTPLHLSIIAKNPDMCSLLISYCAQLNLQNHNGDTPLHIAIMLSQFNIIKLLTYKTDFSNPHHIYDIKNQVGNTPLHLTVELLYYECRRQNAEGIKEWLNIIEHLIVQGANVLLKNDLQKTPFELVTTWIGYNDMITPDNAQKLRYLLHLCVDAPWKGVTATMPPQPSTFPFWAQPSTASAQQFCPPTPTDPTLTREQQVAFYAKQQNWSQVFQLIREGVSPNGLYEDLSALHYAVQYNNPDCVISLLKVRAHIDYSSTRSGTPLHVAICSLWEMCKKSYGTSPQQISAQLDIVILLIGQGANCMIKNAQQHTPQEIFMRSDIGYRDVLTPENGRKIDLLGYMFTCKEEQARTENKQQSSCSVQ